MFDSGKHRCSGGKCRCGGGKCRCGGGKHRCRSGSIDRSQSSLSWGRAVRGGRFQHSFFLCLFASVSSLCTFLSFLVQFSAHGGEKDKWGEILVPTAI